MKNVAFIILLIFALSCEDEDTCECYYAVPDSTSDNGQRIITVEYNCEIGAPQPCM